VSLRQLRAVVPALALVAVAGCGFVQAGHASGVKPDGFVLRGYVSTPGAIPGSGGGCTTNAAAGDVRVGSRIAVTDAAGAALGETTLGAGVRDGNACNFPFQVAAVPRRDDRYLISVGSRSAVSFPAEPLRRDKPAVIQITA
jgi:hypothetical protein